MRLSQDVVLEVKLPKEKKRLAEAKRIHAEANRLRDFYISRNAEGRQRLMEMANSVNHPHFKTQADDLAVTQLAAVKSEKPVVQPVAGVDSADPLRGLIDAMPANQADRITEHYLEWLWEAMEPRKKVANAPQWDCLAKRPNNYYYIEFKTNFKDTNH